MPVSTDDPAIGFVTVALVNTPGYAWSLTTRLGELLHQLEQRYGPRDVMFTPLGIEFGAANPCIWYPGNRRYVSIMLTKDAALNPRLALFQLAHEAVHLLAPTVHAPVVEEGLAALFADQVAAEYALGIHDDTASYNAAASLVTGWLTQFPDAVKAVRSIELCFAKWTPEIVSAVCPGISSALATQLCQPFSR